MPEKIYIKIRDEIKEVMKGFKHERHISYSLQVELALMEWLDKMKKLDETIGFGWGIRKIEQNDAEADVKERNEKK